MQTHVYETVRYLKRFPMNIKPLLETLFFLGIALAVGLLSGAMIIGILTETKFKQTTTHFLYPKHK